jgi:hypothetical protein
MMERRYSSTILHLGTRWRWVVSFMSRPFYSRVKSPRSPFDRRLDVRMWRRKKSLPCQESNITQYHNTMLIYAIYRKQALILISINSKFQHGIIISFTFVWVVDANIMTGGTYSSHGWKFFYFNGIKLTRRPLTKLIIWLVWIKRSHIWFVFGKCLLRISTGAIISLHKILCDFPRFLQI